MFVEFFIITFFILICSNGKKKKARVAITISDKIHFKIKNISRDKDGQYKMIKGSSQKDIIVNIYAPNIGAPQILATIKGAIAKQ